MTCCNQECVYVYSGGYRYWFCRGCGGFKTAPYL